MRGKVKQTGIWPVFVISAICVGLMTYLIYLNMPYNLYYVVGVMYIGSTVSYMVRRRFLEFPFIGSLLLILATVGYMMTASYKEPLSASLIIVTVSQYGGLCIIASVMGSLTGMLIRSVFRGKRIWKRIVAAVCCLGILATVFSFHSAFYGNIFLEMSMYFKFKHYLSEIYPDQKLNMSFVRYNRLNKNYYVACTGLKNGSTLYVYWENNDFETYYDDVKNNEDGGQ